MDRFHGAARVFLTQREPYRSASISPMTISHYVTNGTLVNNNNKNKTIDDDVMYSAHKTNFIGGGAHIVWTKEVIFSLILSSFFVFV